MLSSFQILALAATAVWFVAIVTRFRRSALALIGGLVGLGLLSGFAVATGWIDRSALGLGSPDSWMRTGVYALAGVGALLTWSPAADRVGRLLSEEPPLLDAFEGVRRSKGHLVAGIAAAWLLGGLLEELVARGIVLQAIQSALDGRMPEPIGTFIAIAVAGVGAGLLHMYQGPRAVLITGQLSLLFGVLFVMAGNNLWTVILCHGIFDTIAFVRFATGRSRYSTPT